MKIPIVRISTVALILTVVAGLPSCGNQFRSQMAQEASENIAQDVGCTSLKSQMFNQMYLQIEKQDQLSSAQEISTSLSKSLASRPDFKSISPADRGEMSENIAAAWAELDQYVRANGIETQSDKLALLARVEMGDQTEPELQSLQASLISKLQVVSVFNQKVGVECQSPADATTPVSNPTDGTASPQVGTQFAQWKSERSAQVYGAFKTMATAYQSCDAVNMAPLDFQVPDIKGISVIGTHPNGVGSVRKITNLQNVIATDPYFRGYRRPASSCFAVLDRPLIYDYGGKPYASVNLPTLNLFVNAGSGSAELGIDCSGFVFTAMAAAGLKLKADTPLKPVHVSGVNANMMRNPAANGLTCLNPISVSAKQSILPGDIAASSGHVVMIDEVGIDPLGIAQVKSAADCAKVTSNGFNFSIIQSSPIRNGLGINRIQARDYFAETSVYKNGFEVYAREACLAKFQTSSRKPSSTDITIVRHLGTAACRDKEIELVNQSCVAGCPMQVPVSRP